MARSVHRGEHHEGVGERVEVTAGGGDWLTVGGEHVVPIVGGWPQAADGGMESHHAGGRGVAGAVRVEAAVRCRSRGQAGRRAREDRRERRTWRCRSAADGSGSNSSRRSRTRRGRFPGNRRHRSRSIPSPCGCRGPSPPGPRPGAAQFRAHRPLGLPGHQQKDRIAPAVRIQLARLQRAAR